MRVVRFSASSRNGQCRWPTCQMGIYMGRLVLGVGVGLTVSAGTAWAADINGQGGAVAAGVALTAGFALGPLFSGLTSQFMSETVVIRFIATATLSAIAVLLAWRLRIAADGDNNGLKITPPAQAHQRGVCLVLKAALPMALWVFSAVSVAMVTMAARIGERYSGPLVPGIAAAVTLGPGAFVQLIARRTNWGPHAGIGVAVLAALSFCLAAAADSAPTMPLLLITAILVGCGYGLCLSEGLIDVETMAPRQARGILTGLFYIGAYLGFALPVLLVMTRPLANITTPLLVLACLAAVSALFLVVHIAGDNNVLGVSRRNEAFVAALSTDATGDKGKK